jgi:hypothetical protein
MDLKTLWHKQEADDMPDVKALFKKADDVKRKTRIKLMGQNLMLLGVSAFIIYIGFNISHELLTTKIGIAVIVLGILMYLVVHNQMIPVLFKTNFDISAHEYLEQLISIKRQQDFLNRVMINIYFVFLCTGMGLYLIQFVQSFWDGVLTYGVTFSWILFAGFYLRPRGVKRKQKPLIETIAKLEELNRQLDEEVEK